MITDKDILKLKEVFVTKDEMRDIIKDLKSDIATFKDVIVNRLDTIDQNLTVENGYGDKIENHETRITALESSSKSP